MASFNVVALQARVVEPLTLRASQSGNAFGRLRVFVENRRTRPNNPTNGGFMDVSVFGKIAEFVSKYFSKGDTILINGSLEYDEYVNKEGNKISNWRIIADDVCFCGRRLNQQDNNGGEATQQQAQGGQQFQPQQSQQQPAPAFQQQQQAPQYGNHLTPNLVPGGPRPSQDGYYRNNQQPQQQQPQHYATAQNGYQAPVEEDAPPF
jgi:single-strand DNA-binding protein